MKNPQHVHDAERQIAAVVKYNMPPVAAVRVDRHGTSEREEFEEMVRRLSPDERARFFELLGTQ